MRSAEWRGIVVPCILGGQCVRWSGVKTCFLVSVEGNALGGVAWKHGSLYPRKTMRTVEWRVNVFPCIRGVQCVRWIDVETRFPVSAEGNSLCGVSSKRVSLYPRRAMGTEEWRGNVFSCTRGRQCVRWSVVVAWFLEFEEDNALGGVLWKRVSLNSRKTIRTV